MTRKYYTLSYPLPTGGLVRCGLTTVLRTVCALIYLLLLIPQTATAQCDSQDGTITVTASGGAMNGANLVYVITNPAGVILNYSQAPTFTNVAQGSYQVYAVGYRGSTLLFSVGQGISSVTNGNACVQYSSAPVTYSVCSTNATCDSQDGTVTVTASGASMGTATLSYLLTNASGDIIKASNTPSFTNVAAGTYFVYALGYTTTAVPYSVGQNISVISTNDACARLSPPIGYKVCSPNPPVVTGQPLVTSVNTPGRVCLPVSDADGTSSFSAAICGQPASGTAAVVSAGGNQVCISYTPPTNFTGNAGSLCVIVTDPTGQTATVSVPVVVSPQSGTAPTAQPPVVTGVPITVPVSQTALVCLPVSDPNGTTSFSAAICGQPSSGTAAVVSTSSNNVCISYTPPANFTGNAGTVCLVVTDPTGQTTTVGIPVTVIPDPTPNPAVGQPPVVVGAPLVVNQNTPGSVCLPVSDPDGTSSFTVSVCGQPSSGSVSVASVVNTGSVCVNYVPVNGFSGNVGNVCLVVTDPTGLTSVVQVPVTVIPASVPSSLSANPDSGTLISGTSTTLPVLSNDTNLAGLPASLTTVSLPVITRAPAQGTVVVNADGTVTYTASSSATGQDSFVYQICSLANPAQCDTARVRLQLNAAPVPPNAPVVTGQPLVTSVNTPGRVCLPVSDADGTSSFSAAICGQPASGTAAVVSTSSNNVCISYTPPTNFTGNAGSVCVIVTDPTGQTATVSVPVVVSPQSGTAPTAQPPVVTGVPITVPVSQTALVCLPVSDPNGTTSFSAAICGQPSSGTAAVVSTSANNVCISYTPPANFTGNAGTVCLVVTDPTGQTTTVGIPVTVIPDPTPNPAVGQPPVVVGAPLVVNQNTPGSV
ncbi:Ig-like domain-containing protein, partial [Spirosoma lituiforme]